MTPSYFKPKFSWFRQRSHFFLGGEEPQTWDGLLERMPLEVWGRWLSLSPRLQIWSRMSLFPFLSLAFELATGTLHAPLSKTDHYLPISWLIQGPHDILSTFTSLNIYKLLYILHFNSTRASIPLALYQSPCPLCLSWVFIIPSGTFPLVTSCLKPIL